MIKEDSSISIADLGDSFARDKYVVWRSCLKDPELSLIYRCTCKRADLGTMTHDPSARELNGDRAAQVFLHYVDQTGPYAEWKFDKRNGIPSHQAFGDDPISKQAKLFSWLTEPSRKNRPQ